MAGVVLTLLLKELADPREVPGRSKVFIASVPRNLPPLMVQHPGTKPLAGQDMGERHTVSQSVCLPAC